MKRILIIIGVVLGILMLAFFGLRVYTKSHSPEAKVKFEGKDLTIDLSYCRPAKKNRVIFGELVPYNKVWRTGANEATKITFSRDVKVNGKDLKKGSYSLFTIPTEKNWTIIFNSVVDQWGAFFHSPDKDVLRVEVPSEMSEKVIESFTIALNEADKGAAMELTWDKVKVSVPIE
jgi:hypothetical protein